MPWLDAPVGGLAVQDVEDEALELGPEGSLPEVGVYWDCKGDADQDAD